MTTRSVEALLVNLPIEQLQASTTNPRQHFDRAGLDELKASVAESGIQVPLLVRVRMPDSGADGVFAADEAEYEVVAGGRRYLAAQELGLAVLPCIVRELSDAEAREAQIIENLQRAGVDPLEEAEAFRELRDRLGSIAAVAAKLGKEQSYVAKSLRLLALTLHSRDALRGRLMTIEHALLLARLAETEQNEALKWALDHTAGSKKPVAKVIEERLAWLKKIADDPSRFGRYVWEPQSAAKLKSHIESEGGVKLSRAPWSLEDDALLLSVVPCAQCDRNTKANAPLFGDLDMGDPTCTDGACFQAKTATFVQIALREAGHDPKGGTNGAVPRLSWKSSSVKPSIVFFGPITDKGPRTSMANPAKLLKYGQWIDAKKGSCPNVRPGVTADWSDSGQHGYMGGEKKLRRPGETLLVCIAVGCKVHKKGYEGTKTASVEAGKTRQEREAEHAAEEKLQAQIEEVEPKLRKLIFQAILRKLDGVRALQLANVEYRHAAEMRNWIQECKPGTDGSELEALTAFGNSFRLALHVNAYYISRGGVREDRADLWKLAKQAGVNADQIAAKAFHDGLTPSLTVLYPKGVAWPKTGKTVKQIPTGNDNKKTPAKKVVKKAAKKAAKKVAKKAAKA